MPVRRATAEDIPLVTTLLVAAGVPHEPYRPADPAVEVALVLLPSWMSEENEYTYVDTEAGTLCRISVNHEDKQVVVVWHLPDTKPRAHLMPVLRAAILGLVAEHPEVSIYQRYADHFTEAASHRWRDVIPGSTVLKLLTDPPRWRIVMPPVPVNPDDAPLVRDTVANWPSEIASP